MNVDQIFLLVESEVKLLYRAYNSKYELIIKWLLSHLLMYSSLGPVVNIF